MHRNEKLLRDILQRLADGADGVTANDFPDHDRTVVNAHMGWLVDDGCAEGKELRGDGAPTAWDLMRLTNRGCDRLAELRKGWLQKLAGKAETIAKVVGALRGG
jgi:hypothetical protein